MEVISCERLSGCLSPPPKTSSQKSDKLTKIPPGTVLADFDHDVLTSAALELVTSAIARALLLELGAVGVYHAALEADHFHDPARYGYDATARRGFEAMDQYVARLAEDLVICRCGTPAVPHDPSLQCRRHIGMASAVTREPQLRMF